MAVVDGIEQPTLHQGPTPKRRNIQLTESARRLRDLNFDPLDAQVELFHKLKKEVEVFEKMRTGEFVTLNADGNSRVVKYSGVAHAQVLALLQKVAVDLMRYKYGRVPETVELEIKEAQGLTINLSRDDASYKQLVGDDDME